MRGAVGCKPLFRRSRGAIPRKPSGSWKLAGLARAAAIAAIGTEWAAREPATALAWLAEHPKGERTDPQNYVAGSNDALQMAFANWAERAPSEAQAWAAARPAGGCFLCAQRRHSGRAGSGGE